MHAILVRLCNGLGLDLVRREDWVPKNCSGVCGGSDGGGPTAALYSVGFDFNKRGSSTTLSAGQCHPFRATLVKEGDLTKINGLVQRLDNVLEKAIN